MVMRVKRTVDIIMSNYQEIIGSCVFTYEGRIAYANENMQITKDIQLIIQAWKSRLKSFSIKQMSFLVALNSEDGFVAINPDGAVGFICGTGKGVWFVSVFAPMDADKSGILRECVQAAKNLESSVSVFEI
jgi:hypothetical protein